MATATGQPSQQYQTTGVIYRQELEDSFTDVTGVPLILYLHFF